jgi:DNA-binding transcriptional MerR regulator
MERREPRDPATGLYGISVAADLSGVGPQSLRAYEREGLLSPQRTDGGTRRYSETDLDRVRRITELLAAGLNLSGISLVLDLQDDNRQLRRRLRAARSGDPDERAEP